MRLSNGVELRLVVLDEDHRGPEAHPDAHIVDFCSRQSENNALRRIEALERENEMLRAAASAIQYHVERNDGSGGRGWLEAMSLMLSRKQ